MSKKNNNIELILQKAYSYRGYLEKNSDKDLELFTINAGDKNYTKFAKTVKEYGLGNFQGQPWCAVYVMAIFLELFEEKAKDMLPNFSAWTPSFYNSFKKQGRLRTKGENPQKGDIIFFKNSQRIYHVGIVTGVDKTYVYTNEGNTSNSQKVIPNGGAVCNKRYLLTNPSIAGYGIPNYDIDTNVFDGWQCLNNTYYFYHDRKMLTGCWLEYNGLTYYFLSDGKMAKGQHYIDGLRYYFNEKNGYLVVTNDHGKTQIFSNYKVTIQGD